MALIPIGEDDWLYIGEDDWLYSYSRFHQRWQVAEHTPGRLTRDLSHSARFEPERCLEIKPLESLSSSDLCS
ncbi:hypothetical protein V6N11_017957 [Hibiscus sabdariffa]|uniref:Uncharacterized protein n=1 Tax=Hibiscus sabdariffa TaxID=183260 RepID=A0ABR2T6H2_9ROSI